ncbi:MAG: extensin family protein [Marinovum sp.]|nr:extensin family protein [Marinovum sp.]
MRYIIALLIIALLALTVTAALRMEPSPLPPQWNVFEPLDVAAPVTPLTQWKLDWAIQDRAQCLAVLNGAAAFAPMDDLVEGPNCFISPRLELSGVGQSRLDPLEINCATALRLAMWERHGVQPASRELLGAEVSIIRHIGSYNCRPIRGSTRRWSTHATADAIDISGFDLADGRRVRLIQDWVGDDAEAMFLRRVRDTACRWFKTTLGPDYNTLHADHFHLQSRGWGTCR